MAIKCVCRKDLAKEDETSLRQEVDVMKDLHHENVVEFIDFFEEENFFYVVLEFLEGGELFDRIVEKNCYNEKEARDVVSTILKGMKYCHDKGIVHRDMKPENLLLVSKSDDSSVKLADFGHAIRCGNQKLHLATHAGTPGFVAPEVLQNKAIDKAVDMWAIGVITYTLLGGYPPFLEDNEYKLYRKIIKGKYEFHAEYWSGISWEAKNFISSLIKINPDIRMDCEEALQHPWLYCDSKVLAAHNLTGNLTSLRKYQANRKFRIAGNAVIAAKRLGKGILLSGD